MDQSLSFQTHLMLTKHLLPSVRRSFCEVFQVEFSRFHGCYPRKFKGDLRPRVTKLSKTENMSSTAVHIDGVLTPGTVLYINNHIVTILRYLTEGGFAHIYCASLENSQLVVLKRLSCPDNSTLKELIAEAETHKTVSGHPNIVSFIDYSYSKNRGAEGYEMFIIMEYCSRGGLIDFLNSRLESRPSEAEILAIFSDVCLGVAHLHSMKPPIAHRDIKIENVLIGSNHSYKLCDFGSCTTKHFLPNTKKLSEIQQIEEEINKFTTLQYRAPEMCDLYQKRALSEKVDIWALGVMLYKLCYYVLYFKLFRLHHLKKVGNWLVFEKSINFSLEW